MVRSTSQPCRPHLVQVMEGGKIVCDENCPMWVSLNICSHCVAVAHSVGCAREYALWFSTNTQAINLTKLTTQQVSRDVGKKPRNRYSQQKAKNKKLPITARLQTPSLSSVSLSITNTTVAAAADTVRSITCNDNSIQSSSNSSWNLSPHLYRHATSTPLRSSPAPTPTQLGFSPIPTPTQFSFSPTIMPAQHGFSSPQCLLNLHVASNPLPHQVNLATHQAPCQLNPDSHWTLLHVHQLNLDSHLTPLQLNSLDSHIPSHQIHLASLAHPHLYPVQHLVMQPLPPNLK